MSMSQDLHTHRLKEVEQQRDKALDELKTAKVRAAMHAQESV